LEEIKNPNLSGSLVTRKEILKLGTGPRSSMKARKESIKQTVDSIQIMGLRASTRVGITEEERGTLQSVAFDVVIHPVTNFADLADEIGETIDYFQVSQKLREVAAERPRNLIETLANDLAAATLAGWPVARVGITVRKFILPDSEHVAVCIERERSSRQEIL